jgi:hypothetical protein
MLSISEKSYDPWELYSTTYYNCCFPYKLFFFIKIRSVPLHDRAEKPHLGEVPDAVHDQGGVAGQASRTA